MEDEEPRGYTMAGANRCYDGQVMATITGWKSHGVSAAKYDVHYSV